MAIIAGTYDFTVQRRADHTESIRITDSNDNAVDLSGATIAAQVWDKERTGKYADFTIAYTNRTNGEFTMSLSHTQTLQFTPNETAGPQGAGFDLSLDHDSKVDNSIMYYQASSGKLILDDNVTKLKLVNGGNF